MFKKLNKDKLQKGLYDLTHLEINTIVKSNMTASKITNSPRRLLYELAKVYHLELVNLGNKYSSYYKDYSNKNELFREEIKYKGSGYNSFKELANKAKNSKKWLTDNKLLIHEIDNDELLEDAMILERINLNCDDIRNMVKKHLNLDSEISFEDEFDNPLAIEKFRREENKKKKRQKELDLELEELLRLKKMNDIGIEKILTQTIIGIDGDITTRISKNFAESPNIYITETHQEAISISIKYWTTLIEIFSNFFTKRFN